MGLVQHASAQTTAQNISATFPNPVSEGNLIIAVIGYNAFNPLLGFQEDSYPSTSFSFLGGAPRDGFSNSLEAYMQLALRSESYIDCGIDQ